MPFDLESITSSDDKKSAAPPKASVKTAAAPTRDYGFSLDSITSGPDASQATAPSAAPPGSGGAKTSHIWDPRDSVLKTVTGTSPSEWFQNTEFNKKLESIFPSEVVGNNKNFTGRFLKEAMKFGPGMADFLTSGPGLATLGLNFGARYASPLRPVAAAVDTFWTITAGADAADASLRFIKDPTPENAAQVAGSVFMAWSANKARHTVADRPLTMLEQQPDGTMKEISTSLGREKLLKDVDQQVARTERNQAIIKKATDASAPPTESGAPPKALDIAKAKVDALSDVDTQNLTLRKRIAKTLANSPDTPPWGLPIGPYIRGTAEHVALKTANKPLVGSLYRSFLKTALPDLMDATRDIASDHINRERTMQFDFNSKIEAFDRVVPEADRRLYEYNEDGSIRPANKIAAVIQGTAHESELSPEGRQYAKAIREKINAPNIELLKEMGHIALQEADSYMPQIWERPTSERQWAAWNTMKDRFMKGRVIHDIEDGIRLGLKPKYNDVSQVLKVRQDALIKAVNNQRTANTLGDMGTFVTDTQAKQLGLDRQGWVQMGDIPVLKRAAHRGTATKVRQATDTRPEMRETTAYMSYEPVWAHPQAAPALRSMFGSDQIFTDRGEPYVRKYEQANTLAKHVNLMYSMFHNWAITEAKQAQALGSKLATGDSTGAIKTMKDWWFTDPEVYKGFRDGWLEVTGKEADGSPTFRFQKEARAAIDAGVHLDTAISDAHRSATDALRTMGLDGPKWKRTALAPVRAAGHFESMLQKSLWDYYLPKSMMTLYEGTKADMLNRIGAENRTEGRIKAIEKAAADQVNSALGAIDWREMMASPASQRFMRWVMLAPGWKVSNFRAYSGFLDSSLGADVAKNYAVGAAISWWMGLQAFNYAATAISNSKDKDGVQRPHFTWDNPGPPENMMAVQFGKKPNVESFRTGTEGPDRFITFGKGMLEPVHAAMDPRKWAFGSLAAGPRVAMSLLMNEDPVTGFEYVDMNDSEKKQWIDRLERASTQLVPFMSSDPLRAIYDPQYRQIFPRVGPADILFQSSGLPTRQGYSYDKGKKAYISAMEAAENASTENERAGHLEAATEVLSWMKHNNLKPAVAINEWRKRKSAEIRRSIPIRMPEE